MGSIVGAIAGVSLGTQVLSTIAGVQGQQTQTRAAQEAGKYRAQVLRNNKIIAMRAAEDAITRGRFEERVQRSVTQQQIGSARARAAARGVQADTGSAADIQASIAGIGELDALVIRENARREAMSFRQQATQFESEARLEESGIEAAGISGKIATTSQILSGATSVSAKWLAFRKEGIF